jgi:hypothetical protein
MVALVSLSDLSGKKRTHTNARVTILETQTTCRGVVLFFLVLRRRVVKKERGTDRRFIYVLQ